MSRRLYVAGEGDSLIYCTAASAEDARLTLGPACRTPDPDDLRVVWRMAKMESLSKDEIREKFGVSRQTVDNWWRRAGGAGQLPRRSEFRARDRVARIQKGILSMPEKGATLVARSLGTTAESVREVASAIGVKLPTWKKRPSDRELVEIAKGKTWLEFADAVGLKLATLRNYIYARPKLSRAIRKVRAPLESGSRAHGKISPEKVIELHSEGHSAYRISQILRVEQMAVRHWLKRLSPEGSDAHANDQGATASSVAGRHGGAVRES